MKRTAWALGGVLALSIGAWLAVPPLARWQAQLRLSELTGRSVSVGSASFQPWSLELTLNDLVVGAAAAPAGAPATDSAVPFAQVARIRVNLAASSIFRRAPVIEALEIDAPRLRLARLSEGHYDLDDLIARLAAPGNAPAAEPARFALYNVQLRDGQLRFDDRPAGRVHAIDALQLGLPFVSSLPSEVEAKVEPHLAFKLNGTPFDTDAQATPFATDRQGRVQLKVADLDLAPYLGYLPAALPVRPTRGALSAELALRFAQRRGAAPELAVSGWIAARELALVQAGGAPLVEWRLLRLGMRDLQPLVRRLAFTTLRVEGAQLHLDRDAAGRVSLLQTLASPAVPPAAAAEVRAAASAASGSGAGAAPAAPPWQLSLEAIELADARLLWHDAAVAPAAALQLEDLSLEAGKLQWPFVQPVPLKLAATLRPQAALAGPAGHFELQGSATDRVATLELTLSELSLGALSPYLSQALVPRVEGRLAAQARLDWSVEEGAPRLRLAVDHATLDALRVQPAGAASGRAALRQLALAEVQIDALARSATIGSLKLAQPALQLGRDAEGEFDLVHWLRPPADAAGAAAAGVEPAPPAPAAAGWQVQLRSLEIDGGRLDFTDAQQPRAIGEGPLAIAVNLQHLGLQDLAWPGDRGTAAAKVQLSARVGDDPAPARAGARPAGLVEWNGEFGLQPLRAGGKLRIQRFPLHLFADYVADRLPLQVLRAQADYNGRFALQQDAAGLAATAAGDVLLAGVHVATRADAAGPARAATEAEDLLNWRTLALQRVNLALQPGQRPRLEVGEAALNDFYARLRVTEKGHFNLQDVAAPGPAATEAAPAARVQVPAAVGAAAPTGMPLDLRVGATRLTNGRVDFSDHFVRPNYSAGLTELNGELGPFSSSSREMASLQLRGRAEGTAQLEIGGRLNPSVEPLALDIKARATDLELAPLSPYAGKYAGYAIEHGKLSLDVAYKIDADGRLEASNQLVLNQLTFGERIDSPDATRLPVLLAVALLKDRNGVIDIQLPISGSLDDPQFSVGGIIFRLVVNLLAKAITSPFALLAGGGGGAEDPGFVAFEAGTPVIAGAGAGALDKIVPPLTDRPNLTVTITGSADPVSEADAFRRAAIEARLRAEQRREAQRSGAAPDAPPAGLTPEARLRLLEALYRRSDIPDKPRNLLGFAKTLSGPEMEELLRRHVTVTPEAMRELAQHRGLALRDALLARGLPAERLFLAAPKLREGGADDAAWTPRVELSVSLK